MVKSQAKRARPAARKVAKGREWSRGRTESVVLSFEMSGAQYRRVKPHFDRLIGRHDLVCHVRLEEES